MTYPAPTTQLIDKYRKLYLDSFWERFDYKNWGQQGPRFLFLYAVWGARYEAKGEDWLSAIIHGAEDEVPEKRVKSWESISALREYVMLRSEGMDLMPWLLSPGWWEMKWRTLQGRNGGIHLVGPKIAAWILRDVTYMRDYRPEIKQAQVSFNETRNSAWFAKLTLEDQAACIPVDIHVFRGALENGAISEDDFGSNPGPVQADQETHLAVAKEIVCWSRDKGFDPRDLDVLWYAVGSGTFEK